LLAEAGGEMPALALKDALHVAGIGRDNAERAIRELNLVRKKVGGPRSEWVYSMPPDDFGLVGGEL
jgi:hypothetical protein